MEERDLHIASKRMLKLIDILKDSGTIKNRQEFLDKIGLQKQHFRQIKTLKTQDFRLDHILKASKTYRINVNWIFGIEKEMFRK